MRSAYDLYFFDVTTHVLTRLLANQTLLRESIALDGTCMFLYGSTYTGPASFARWDNNTNQLVNMVTTPNYGQVIRSIFRSFLTS